MNIFKFEQGSKLYFPVFTDRLIDDIRELIGLESLQNVYGMVSDKYKLGPTRTAYGMPKENLVFGSPMFDLIAPRECFGFMGFVSTGVDDCIRRLEFYYRHLMQYGVLVIRGSLTDFKNPKVMKYIASYFKKFSLFSNFESGRCYLVCVKKRGKSIKDEQELLAMCRRPYSLEEDFSEESGEAMYSVPVFTGEFRFRSRKLTHESAIEIANENIGALNTFMSRYMQTAGSSRDVNTIHPPRVGHQAILIASGEFDGVYLYDNEIVVLNGTVTNNRFKSALEDGEIESLKPMSTIVALNLSETFREGQLSVSNLE